MAIELSYPGFEEYENALLILEGGRSCFRGDVAKRLGSVNLIHGKKFLHHAQGQFSAVYKLLNSEGEWALRCQLQRPPSNLASRYQWLEAFRKERCASYLLPMFYSDPGIVAGGREVPVVVMEWTDNQDLRRAVGSLVAAGNINGLSALAERFEQLCRRMVRDGLAHGDLSHGNVLVKADGTIVLVDYDTVYRCDSPACRREIFGTPGYCHPRPTEEMQKESMDMDLLPAKIISVSLRALAAKPTLFGQFGDENLLFSPEDVLSHQRSHAFISIKALVPSLLNDLLAIEAHLEGRAPAPTLVSSYVPEDPPSLPTRHQPTLPYKPSDPPPLSQKAYKAGGS